VTRSSTADGPATVRVRVAEKVLVEVRVTSGPSVTEMVEVTCLLSVANFEIGAGVTIVEDVTFVSLDSYFVMVDVAERVIVDWLLVTFVTKFALTVTVVETN
jgi:hypothetical protein